MMQFSKEMRSILPVGDITECIPDEVADVAVLEEPEHLNWYHHGRRWKNKFRRVIGIVHTNYLAYVRREKNGQVIACFLKYANTWVTRIYCHKVIYYAYLHWIICFDENFLVNIMSMMTILSWHKLTIYNIVVWWQYCAFARFSSPA